MKDKVFFSYSVKDSDQIENLKAALMEQGIISNVELPSYEDQYPMIPGISVRGAIRDAVASANTVVVFWTKNSATSEFVNYEIGMADALNKDLLVVMPKGESIALPSNLSDIQVLKIDVKG